MPKRSVAIVVLVGLYLAGWIILAGTFLSKGLKEEAGRSAHCLKEPISRLIERAYRSKDDLTMQSAIQDLGHAPGISFACILDQDEKILAHSRLAQLGKLFRFSRDARDIYSFPLRDEHSRWGTLLFSMSYQRSRILWRKSSVINLGAAVFLCLGILGWSFYLEKRLSQGTLAIAERDALLAAEKANFHRLEERLQSAQEAWSSLARSAVSHTARGLILLDQCQRVVAANQSAVRLLKSGDESALVGKSWQDLAFLQSCGSSLEESLLSPGIEIKTTNSVDGSTIVLSTLKDGSGMWIALPPLSEM